MEGFAKVETCIPNVETQTDRWWTHTHTTQRKRTIVWVLVKRERGVQAQHTLKDTIHQKSKLKEFRSDWQES
jgi:hypothetical protein